MRKIRTIVIDGKTWTLTQHPATEGINILHSVVNLAGEAIVALSGAGDASSILNLDLGLDAIGRLAKGLVGQLTDDKVTWLVKLITKYVVDPDGHPVQSEKEDRFDDTFAGQYGLLGQVVLWVLKENFDEVFRSTGVAKLLAAVAPGTGESRPQDSAPPSGSKTGHA